MTMKDLDCCGMLRHNVMNNHVGSNCFRHIRISSCAVRKISFVYRSFVIKCDRFEIKTIPTSVLWYYYNTKALAVHHEISCEAFNVLPGVLPLLLGVSSDVPLCLDSGIKSAISFSLFYFVRVSSQCGSRKLPNV